MPIPLAVVAAVAGIAASSAAVVTCGVTVFRTVQGYNMDPRIAVKKQQKDLRKMAHHKAARAENNADYLAGKMSRKTFEYWDDLHSGLMADYHQRMADRAAMYQPLNMPDAAEEMAKEIAGSPA